MPLKEYQNPIKSGKVSWSEPKDVAGHSFYRDGDKQQTLINTKNKEPVFSKGTEENRPYQMDNSFRWMASDKEKLDENGMNTVEKQERENAFLTNDIKNYINNVASSQNIGDEGRINLIKKIVKGEGLGKEQAKHIFEHTFGDSEDFHRTKEDLLNVIGGYDPRYNKQGNIDSLSEELANRLYLANRMFREENGKSKNYFRDQVNRMVDYVSSLERNDRALTGGSYYKDNKYKDVFYSMIRALNEGKDIKDLIVNLETKGDNFFSDNDYAYENHETDWDGPQQDIDNTVKRNTEPGKYQRQMAQKKELNNLFSKDRNEKTDEDFDEIMRKYYGLSVR